MQQKSAACSGKKMGKAAAATTSTKRPDIGKCGTDIFLGAPLCVISMILVSLENVTKYSHVVARLPQRLKSTLFEIFSTLRVPFGHPPFKKISNNVDFSL